ncbi:MAG: hypothetical protein ACTSPY_12095 [Candidatus Helarchaeota archaeon]
MTRVKNLKEIMKEMKEIYDKNPKDWKVIAGRTPNSYNDLFFCQTNDEDEEFNIWQVKAERMSPFNILGVGTKIRHIDDDIVKKIMNEGKPAFLFGMVVPQDKGIISATGPMNYSDNTIKQVKEDLSKTSDKNLILEKLLKKRLKELIEKEHPGRFNMYG